MKVYLAASWSRKEEIRKVAEELWELGVEVQARWLFELLPAAFDYSFLRHRAEIDVQDVLDCDILVRFSDDLDRETVPAKLATGSRMFEMGVAWVKGKQIIVVGGHQPIFDYLPDITHLETVEQLKEYLSEVVSVDHWGV